jgi:hypothetical protein
MPPLPMKELASNPWYWPICSFANVGSKCVSIPFAPPLATTPKRCNNLASARSPWMLSRVFPNMAWIWLVNMHVPLSVMKDMPLAWSTNYIVCGYCWSGILPHNVSTTQGVVVWHSTTSCMAFICIVSYTVLHLEHVNIVKRERMQETDHCPLARCPAEPGINVLG